MTSGPYRVSLIKHNGCMGRGITVSIANVLFEIDAIPNQIPLQYMLESLAQKL